MQNWAEDLYFKQLDLNYPGVSDAMVQILICQYFDTVLANSMPLALR
jgi:hypothetical protein